VVSTTGKTSIEVGKYDKKNVERGMEDRIGNYELWIGKVGELENWMCDEMV